ncbi:MAG: sigma-70 family RNA polymerase sigma factor [Verrucomicrobia bacterium]|nr:sigma-70 family RNA polymerase sigma factor [Verrucomicrobiota bacterium]
MSPDSELVRAYVAEGSEAAFRTLVTRHANLVYATALRQVGDSGIAEEITQNVFIALSKKAPRLARVQTLAGWLHRTAILESKARIRSELRRRTREQTAAALAEVEHQEDISLELLVPLVDEALLDLRESDRLALVLRFFENRSLREVGGVLGVDEDAARKRISRALIRVMNFFQQRGFNLPLGTGMAVVLTSSAQAAPAGLVTASINAGLAAGKTTSGVGLLLFHLMNMGTKKAVIGCLLLAAAPLFWQSHLEARLNQEQLGLESESAATDRQLEVVETRLREVTATSSLLQMKVQSAEAHLATLNAQRTGKVQAPVYQWDDNSPYMRVPKQMLNELPSSVTFRNGKVGINDIAPEFLQMTQEQRHTIEVALQDFHEAYQNLLANNVRRVEPTEAEIRRKSRGGQEVRAFEIGSMKGELFQLREGFFGELQTILGADRFQLFRSTLQQWMPIYEKDTGVSSSRGIVSFEHRRAFYEPPIGNGSLNYVLTRDNGSMSGPMFLDEIPRAFASELQDWIELARQAAPKETSAR